MSQNPQYVPIAGTGVIGKVFIPRDYSEGMAVKFDTRFPEDLRGRVDERTWQDTINAINQIFAEAESLDCRTYCESCMSCMTGYLLNLCMESHYEKCVKRAGEYIEDVNNDRFIPRGLMIIDPMDRGLRVIEVCVLDSSRRS